MRADAHLEAARAHEERAAQLERWPDSRQGLAGESDFRQIGGFWYQGWDTAREQEQLAQSHRGAAGQLQAAFDEACVDVPSELVSVSPLQEYGVGGIPTPDGVIMLLSSEAGPAPQLLGRMRCHRAWMMLSQAGMDDCPLDLEGIQVDAYGDASGVSVEIKVRDRNLVPELQRRAAHDLELAAKRQPR